MKKYISISVLVLILVICLLFYVYNPSKKDILGLDDKGVSDIEVVDMNSPYFENEFYKNIENDLFQIIESNNDFMESLKHFDFEYYNTIDKKAKNKRVFYVFYSNSNKYLLKRYLFENDDEFELQLPTGENYHLITNSFPTFTAKISLVSNLENSTIEFFDNYTKGVRGELTEGGSTNPKKIMIRLQLTGPEATLIYDDVAGYIIRTTTLKFLRAE